MAFRTVNSLCEADSATPQMTTQQKKLTEMSRTVRLSVTGVLDFDQST
jgi:hypothetical protein